MVTMHARGDVLVEHTPLALDRVRNDFVADEVLDLRDVVEEATS